MFLDEDVHGCGAALVGAGAEVRNDAISVVLINEVELIAVLEPFSRRPALRGWTNCFYGFLLAERPVHE